VPRAIGAGFGVCNGKMNRRFALARGFVPRMAIAVTMPDTFPAGTTVQFTASFVDYAADDGWTTLLYVAGPSAMTPATGSANGAAFDFTITAAVSGALLPGNYQWQVLATKGGVGTFVADSGTVEVTPNIATATAGSMQSWAAATLPLVEAAIAGQVTANVASYQIGNRSLVKLSIDELLKLRAYCETILQSERDPGAFLQTGSFRFTEPGP